MVRKCSVINCKSNYCSQHEKVAIYRFPTKPDQLRIWKEALGARVKSQITRHMGICARHWPANAPKTKGKGGFLTPSVPPTVFYSDSTSPSHSSPPCRARCSESRGTLAECRNYVSDELLDFDKSDKLHGDFNHFKKLLPEKRLPVDFIIKEDYVLLLTISDELQMDFVIKISSDFSVTSKRFLEKVNIPINLLGFQRRLERWSQLENIISFVKNYETSYVNQIRSLREQAQILNDSKNSSTSILLDLIDLSESEPKGRRYNADITLVSLKLYLVSKSCYKMLRSFLPFPSPQTLTKCIGSFNNIGSEIEAESVCKTVFSMSASKRCGLVIDEVRILPSLRYRGGHILGYAEDAPEKIARAVLAIMIKPLFCKTRAFIIRLVPVFSLTGSFLKDLVLKSLEIIFHAGGSSLYVMLSMKLRMEHIFYPLKNVRFFSISPVILLKKEGLRCEQNLDDFIDPGDQDFLVILNRGLLTLPPKDLFYLCQASFIFFKTSGRHLCHRRLVHCLSTLHDHFFNLKNSHDICKRLSNIFLSGFIRRENDLIRIKDDTRKKVKLSGVTNDQL